MNEALFLEGRSFNIFQNTLTQYLQINIFIWNFQLKKHVKLWFSQIKILLCNLFSVCHLHVILPNCVLRLFIRMSSPFREWSGALSRGGAHSNKYGTHSIYINLDYTKFTQIKFTRIEIVHNIATSILYELHPNKNYPNHSLQEKN